MPVTDISVEGGLIIIQKQGTNPDTGQPYDPFTDQADNVGWSFNDTTLLSIFTEKTHQIELADLTISSVAPGTKGAAETALKALFPDANTGTGGTGSTDTSSKIIDGIDIIWLSGLTFLATQGRGRLNGTIYPFPGGTTSLDAADPDDPRIDLIGIQLNVAGTAFELFNIAGTPAADPAEPTYDNTAQIRVTIVSVAAGATEPSNISDVVMYAENLGTGGGEFDVAGTASAFNKNSGANTQTGSKAIAVTGMNNGQYIQFTAAAPFNISTVDKIIIPIRLASNLNNNRNLVISLMNGNTVVSNTIQATTKGLTRNSTGSFQTIVIDVNSFTYTNTNITRMRISMTGTGGTINFSLDNIRFQKGITQVTNVFANTAPIAVTYLQLVNLGNNNAIIPEATYLLTDFATTHIIQNSIGDVVHTAAVERLILRGATPNSLYPTGYSFENGDTVLYDPAGSGIPGSTKGCIYRRINQVSNIDVPFDYLGVVNRRWQVDGAAIADYNGATAYVAGNLVKSGIDIYLAVQASTGENLTQPSEFWMKLVIKTDSYTAVYSTDPIHYDVADFSVDIPVNAAAFNDYSTFMDDVANVLIKSVNGHPLINCIFFSDVRDLETNGDFYDNTFFNLCGTNRLTNFFYNIAASYFITNDITGVSQTLFAGTFSANLWTGQSSAGNIIGNNTAGNIFRDNLSANVFIYNLAQCTFGSAVSYNIIGQIGNATIAGSVQNQKLFVADHPVLNLTMTKQIVIGDGGSTAIILYYNSTLHIFSEG